MKLSSCSNEIQSYHRQIKEMEKDREKQKISLSLLSRVSFERRVSSHACPNEGEIQFPDIWIRANYAWCMNVGGRRHRVICIFLSSSLRPRAREAEIWMSSPATYRILLNLFRLCASLFIWEATARVCGDDLHFLESTFIYICGGVARGRVAKFRLVDRFYFPACWLCLNI